MSNAKNKTFWELFKAHFPLEMRAATENVLMSPSQITIGKQENVLRGRVESLKQLKNHVFSSGSSSPNANSPKVNTPNANSPKVNTPKANMPKNNKNKAASRSSTGSVKSPANMFGGKRTRRKRRN